jgi:hypothetical protein
MLSVAVDFLHGNLTFHQEVTMAIKIATPKTPSAPMLPSDLAPDFALIQEQFPKIGEKMTLMWGSVALQAYLNKTIFDERGGRQGFPMPVVSALMRLYDYHASLMPAPGAGDAWEQVARP